LDQALKISRLPIYSPKTFIKKHIANALEEVDAAEKAPKFKAKIDPDLP